MADVEQVASTAGNQPLVAPSLPPSSSLSLSPPFSLCKVGNSIAPTQTKENGLEVKLSISKVCYGICRKQKQVPETQEGACEQECCHSECWLAGGMQEHGGWAMCVRTNVLNEPSSENHFMQ